jgi:type I restriction-modification system DNA methylase subunit
MTDTGPRVFVDINDIAQIAGVGRSAVGNWRKRHSDFPLANASDQFELEEVERWLVEKGKIAGRAPRAFILWRLADTMRNVAKPEELMRFVLATLVYLEACERAGVERQAIDNRVDVEHEYSWPAVREAADDNLAAHLLDAANAIEDANPTLAELIAPGLSLAHRTDAWVLRTFLDTIEEAAKDAVTTRCALFEEAISRVHEGDRFLGEFSTPPDLTRLMVRLGAAQGGTVLDLASGEGGLLLIAALGDDRNGLRPMDLIGYEKNSEIMRVSRARFFLYDVPAELINADVFRVSPDDVPAADLVLLDPPLGVSEWGDADVYLDDRWSYGVPPPNSADMAWLQIAVQSLALGGRAAVLTTPGATFRGGREARIRSALLVAGTVVAVVLLPGRLRANTSIPLALWVLRTPDDVAALSVLLVDASQLGETGRSLHSLEEADIDRIVAAVHTFEADPGRTPEDSKIAWAVPVSDLDESNLDPTRYRPVTEVNVDELHRRSAELRANLGVTTADVESAIYAVLSRLDRTR